MNRDGMIQMASGFRPLQGSGWIAVTHAASKGALIVTAIVAARALDVTTFGFLMSLYAVVLIASVVWDMGMSSMISRDIAAGELTIYTGIRTITRTRVYVLPLWGAAFALGASLVWINRDEALWSVLIFAGVSLAHNISTFIEALLHSQLLFRSSAQAIAVGRAVQVVMGLGILFVAPEWDLVAIAAVFLAGETGCALMLLRALNRDRGLGRQTAGGGHVSWSVTAALRRAVPYALSGWFKLGYGKADLIMVSVLATTLQAGLYAPATRIQDALLVVPGIAVGTLMPLAARAGNEDRKTSGERILSQGLLISFVACIVAAAVTFLLIPLLPHLLGAGFSGAIRPARILVWSLPFAGVQAAILAALIARGRAVATTVVHATALMVTLIAHAILDPRFGAVGGAWASFLREPFALAVAVVLLRRTTSNRASAEANA